MVASGFINNKVVWFKTFKLFFFKSFLIFIVFGDVEDSRHVWVLVANLETLREILVDIKQSTLAQRGMGLL